MTKGKKNGLEKEILDFLRSGPKRIGELERALNKSPETIEETIEEMKSRGENIRWEARDKTYYIKQGLRSRFEAVPKDVLYTENIIRKLGISETHIGGRHSQPHFVPISAALAKTGEFGKIDIVTHYGDVCNGLKHKDYSRGENILNTADEQIDAGIEVLGCYDDLPVYVRPGDHDMWQYSDLGLNMVKWIIRVLNLLRQIQGKEPNFFYVGSDDSDQATVKGFIFEFKHIMSAQSRGLTTKSQYMFEDRIGDFVKELRGENSQEHMAQPDHIGCGNWHREISFFHGGTAIDLYPGFQASTSWEKDMGIVHKFGAKIVTLRKDKHGNIFCYDVRYLDFSSDIKVIKKRDLQKNSADFALGIFREYKEKLSNIAIPSTAKE